MMGIGNRIVRRARRSAVVHRLMWPFGRDLRPDRWIFVLGCYKSGTTVLARILGSHPEINALPREGVFLTDSLPHPEQFGWTRMWARCLDDVGLDPGELPERKIRKIKKQWSLWLPRDASNVLEKSVVNSARIPFLDAHFSPAYFIAIVRNGYAVAEGIRRSASPGRWGNQQFPVAYPIELCAEQWKVSDEVISRDRSRVGRFVQIRYEELVEEPETVLRRITGFLGLPPMDAEVVDRTWALQGHDDPIRNMNPRSLARLSAADRRSIESVAGDVLQKYGYTDGA